MEHEDEVAIIVGGGLETVLKNLERRLFELEIRGRNERIQTPALLKSAEMLKRMLKTQRDLLPLRLQ